MIRLSIPFALLLSTPALAETALADLAAIEREVASFAGAAQGQSGGAALPLDRRLRLTACPVPLALGWYGGRQDVVEVACPAAGGWKLYVPLAAKSAAAPGEQAITRGDQVTITVRSEGFAVSQSGQALEGGVRGAWIKVRGLAQGAQVLRARVLRPGVVGMDLP